MTRHRQPDPRMTEIGPAWLGGLMIKFRAFGTGGPVVAGERRTSSMTTTLSLRLAQGAASGVFLITAAVALSALGGSASEASLEPGETRLPARAAAALVTSNGLPGLTTTTNGLTTNSLTQNALTQNGVLTRNGV